MSDNSSHDSNPVCEEGNTATHEVETDFRDLPLWKLEAIREEHRSDEAMVLGFGWAKYLMGLLLIAQAAILFFYHLETYIAVRKAVPPLSAPWVFNGPTILAIVLLVILGLAQFPAGYALRRLRGWSMTAQIALLPLWILNTLAGFGLALHDKSSASALMVVSFYCMLQVAYCTDLYILAGRSISVLFSIEYQIVVERTPHIKVRKKIPRKIKMIRGMLILPFLLLFIMGALWSPTQE
jgi:hypothetical protein